MADTPREAVEGVLDEFAVGMHASFEWNGARCCATCHVEQPCGTRRMAAEVARLRQEVAFHKMDRASVHASLSSDYDESERLRAEAEAEIARLRTELQQARADAERWQKVRTAAGMEGHAGRSRLVALWTPGIYVTPDEYADALRSPAPESR